MSKPVFIFTWNDVEQLGIKLAGELNAPLIPLALKLWRHHHILGFMLIVE